MSFVKQNVNKAPIEDTVFAIVKRERRPRLLSVQNEFSMRPSVLYIMKKGPSLPLTACLHPIMTLQRKQRLPMRPALSAMILSVNRSMNGL